LLLCCTSHHAVLYRVLTLPSIHSHIRTGKQDTTALLPPATHGSWSDRDTRLALVPILLGAGSPASLKRLASPFSLVFGILLFFFLLFFFLLFLAPMARSVLLALHSLPLLLSLSAVVPRSLNRLAPDTSLDLLSSLLPPSSSSSSSSSALAHLLPASSHTTLPPALDTTPTQATVLSTAEAQAEIPSSSAPALEDVLEALTTHNQRLETANRALSIFAGRLMQEQTAWLEQQMEQHEAALAHVRSARTESDSLQADLALVQEALQQRDHQIQSLQTLLNQYQELKGESAQGFGLDESFNAQRPIVQWTASQQEADGCRKLQAAEVDPARGKVVAGQEEVQPVRQLLMERTGSVEAETRRKGKGWWSWWGLMR